MDNTDFRVVIAALGIFSAVSVASVGAEEKMKVDCGNEASFFSELTYEKQLAPIRTLTQGLQDIVDDHAKIKALLGDDLDSFQDTLSRLDELLAKKKYYDFSKILNTYVPRLEETRDRLVVLLDEQYESYWTRPAITSMASPWSAEIYIRQNDILKMEVGLLARPTSSSHAFHPQSALRRPFGWIEIATSAQERRESTALGLDYDLGLQDFNYDPLLSRYTYREGEVRVEVMDRAAVRMAGEGLRLEVSVDVPGLQLEGAMVWRKVLSVLDTPIYAGIVFQGLDETQLSASVEQRRFDCLGFTVLWADTLAELKDLGENMADWKTSEQQTKHWIAEKMIPTQLTGSARLVARVEMEKRTFLSMFHQFGGIYAAMDGNYNSIWVRDTSIVAVFAALSGNPEYLRKWTPYVIANPTPLEEGGRTYNTFIVDPYDGKRIFKEQDDGPAYAVLSAYAYWKLLDDDSQLMQWYGTLKDSMDFLEVHSYKPEAGLYGEYMINEAPLKGSSYWKDEQYESMKVEGEWPMYIESLYLNQLMHASQLMMGEIALEVGRPEDSQRFFARAADLAQKIDILLWREDKGAYLAGLAVTEEGRSLDVPMEYYNIYFDYVWALTLYPQMPNIQRSLASHEVCVRKYTYPNLSGYKFTPTYGHSASVYGGWLGRYPEAVRLLDYVTELCQTDEWSDGFKALYAMKGSMPEVTYTVKFHRPQTFASAPVMQAIVALGAAVDFNGINVVPSGYMDKVGELHFKKGIYDIDLRPVGVTGGLVVDGVEVPYTLRIPSSFYTSGHHTVTLQEAPDGQKDTLLLYTSLELLGVEKLEDDAVVFRITGYGPGMLRFAHCEGKTPNVRNASGQPIDFEQWADATGTFLQVNTDGLPLEIIWP